MWCNNCGAEVKDGSNFCPNCGAGLNAPKTINNSNKNFIERFRDANIIIKLIIIIFAVFIFLLLLSWVGHIFFGFPLESYTEGDATYRPSEFDQVDIDGDGAISFYEIEDLSSDIAYNDLLDMFNGADKNNNGVLKGAEFDGFVHRLEKYYKDIEKQQKDTQEKEDSSSSSSSISKSPKYIDACPECGSRDIIEYTDSYGYIRYQCSQCDYWSYDDDDFVIEASSIKCILPVLESNLAVT